MIKFLLSEQKNELYKKHNVIAIESEDGIDWYEYSKKLKLGLYATVTDEMMIVSISEDATTLVPINLYFTEIPDKANLGDYFINGRIFKSEHVVVENGKPRVLSSVEIDNNKRLENIKSIKKSANEIIENKYPIWKQLNLLRENTLESQTMIKYIDSVRVFSNEMEKRNVSNSLIDWNNLKVI